MTDLNPVRRVRIEEKRRRFKGADFFLKAGLLAFLFLVPFLSGVPGGMASMDSSGLKLKAPIVREYLTFSP